MEHYLFKDKNEEITIYTNAESETDNCILWQLTNKKEIVEIEQNLEINSTDNGLFNTSLTLPDNDCYVFGLFNEEPIVIKVGQPKNLLLYYGDATGLNVDYSIVENSGELITTGVMEELANGFYYVDVADYEQNIIIIDDTPYPIRPYNKQSIASVSGTIKLQNNAWQLIAIPVKNSNIKEYFVDRLADKYNVAPEDMIEICSAFFGNEGRFRSYIPGVTNPNTSNNFPLVYEDDGNYEVTGFWVKLKDMTGIISDVDNIIFEWEA